MIFQLNKELIFPNPALAEPDGLLAIGGDLLPERLMLAYRHGIFPWYSEGEPILWHSPHERFILFPDEVKVSRSMKQFLKKEEVEIRFNSNFKEVIKNCANIKREGQVGTWIINDMQKAYIKLHELGHAFSVETYINGELCGGLYGVKSGNVFCGESMFSKKPNASKAALIWLCENLNIALVDCQVHTAHLESLGARFITRDEYLKFLNDDR